VIATATTRRSRSRTARTAARISPILGPDGSPLPAGRGAIGGVGYEAADTSRRRRQMGVIGGGTGSADRHLASTGLGRLREICRTHDRNSGLLHGLLDRAVDNIFGSGPISLRPMTGDAASDAAQAAFFAEITAPEAADAAGRADFSELARTCLRAVWTDGDILIADRAGDGAALIYEADQIISPRQKGDATGTARIVQGVELDPYNRPVAFHVAGRKTSGDFGSVRSEAATTRIPASDAALAAYRTRTAQTRGVPFLAAALSLFDNLDAYLDAETMAAHINSLLALKITREAAEADEDGIDDNDEDSTFEKVQKFEQGMVFDMPPGEDLAMVTASRPGSNFESYITTACRIVGVAVGFPLELILLDFSKTNYSSSRASLEEARRSFRGWQGFAERQIARPKLDRAIRRAIASGRLPADGRLYQYRIAWPSWGYINPIDDARANQLLVSYGSKSISECIRERGREPGEVFDELAADLKRARELGIPVQLAQGIAASPAAAASTAAPPPESGQPVDTSRPDDSGQPDDATKPAEEGAP